MPNISANGIQIEYDTFGDSSKPVLLLVMGLGAQMIHWDEEFCQMLADTGLYVIRFDNRDIGLSGKLEEGGIPNIMEMMAASTSGQPVEAPYTLDEMADDAAGLLTALSIEKAHIAGASMGGMIVQTIAIRHPEKVLSLTSIMSTTGDPEVPPASPEAMAVLLTPAPTEREAYLDNAFQSWLVIGSSGLPYDEARLREKAALAFDRSFYPQGMARQMAAIMAHGDRTEGLKKLDVPTLVIHGKADPLVSVEGGKATVAAIPGADILLIDDMGHDLPMAVWPQVVDAISALTAKA